MSPAVATGAAEDSSPAVRLLEVAAMACILAVLVARPFVAEMPFRTSQLVLAKGSPEEIQKPPGELMRVTFAMILLAAAALWALAGAFRRRMRLAGPAFALMAVVFAGWSMFSALGAVDRRGALDGWLEQLAILLAALVMMQLARRKQRWGMVVVVLAALAATLAVKSFEQVASEIPHRIADLRADPEKVLAAQGIQPGTPKAAMLEKRLVDPAATGYFGLANVFASLLIILFAAGAGLAIEKLAAARRERQSKPALKPGEIHLPTLAALISIVFGAAAAPALVLTRSKGGIAAAAGAIILGVVLMARRTFFSRHRRKALLACAAAVLAGICAVAGYGTLQGHLPSRSMQVRWEYWTGAARVVRDRPLRGVGPGNFGDAYLVHRLPAAAESTKSAHNLFFDAACAYGLPGAAVYLAMLIWVLVTLTRPAPPPAGLPGDGRAMLRWCAFLSVIVLIVRAVWIGVADPAVLLVEALIPAAVFAVALLAAVWTGRRFGAAGAGGRWARIAVGCGLVGFALHNLVTFTLWSPAAATAFWIAAGAAAGAALPRRVWRLPRAASVPIAAAAIFGLIMAGVWLWRPVLERTAHLRAAQSAYCRGWLGATAAHMKLAAAADELDGRVAADLSGLYLSAVQADPQAAGEQMLAAALRFAREAYRRSPKAFHAILYARALWARGDPQEALELAEKAVSLDPMNIRLRWEYAEMLCQAKRFDAASRQLSEFHRIDQALPQDSDLRLTREELDRLEMLDLKIRAGNKPIAPLRH